MGKSKEVKRVEAVRRQRRYSEALVFDKLAAAYERRGSSARERARLLGLAVG